MVPRLPPITDLVYSVWFVHGPTRRVPQKRRGNIWRRWLVLLELFEIAADWLEEPLERLLTYKILVGTLHHVRRNERRYERMRNRRREK